MELTKFFGKQYKLSFFSSSYRINAFISYISFSLFSKRKENTCYYSHWEIGKLRGGTEHSIESISTEETEILTEITSKLLSEEKWTPFRYSVDFSEYPEYYASVPYPMYLELIHKRVTHKYYRSVAVSSKYIIFLS